MARLKPKTQVKRPVFSWSSGKEVVDRDTIHRGWFIDRTYAVARSSGGHAVSGSGRRSPC